MKEVLFVTGTRADFGKLKPLMQAVDRHPAFTCRIFVTGMHMMARYGLTAEEVAKAGFENIHTFINQFRGEPAELVLANTIHGLARYVHEYSPDLIVVHGDRVEALAGAAVGALRNVLVAHVEGGELSGAVDELLRHAVTKLAHLHFVANQEAAERLKQLGETESSVHVVGSPDIDVMLSDTLPEVEEVKRRYDIPFTDFGILLFHPVSTDRGRLSDAARSVVQAVLESGIDTVVIYPNNDEGGEVIFREYAALEGRSRIRMFPSMRFEYFLTLLKHARFILGNSSAGVREAPVFPVPTINVGNRQENRFAHNSIINVDYDKEQIGRAIQAALEMGPLMPSHHFGRGDSARRFMRALTSPELWATPTQKQFLDRPQLAMSL